MASPTNFNEKGTLQRPSVNELNKVERVFIQLGPHSQAGQSSLDDGDGEPINEMLLGGILDQLTKEEVLTHSPHSLIGLIKGLTSEEEAFYGSGILISPDLVLTCAHNLFHPELKTENKNLEFYPRQYGELEKAYEIQSSFYPQAFKEDVRVFNDYALLKLAKRVNGIEYFIPLCVNYQELSFS
jgi:hypothetical protein